MGCFCHPTYKRALGLLAFPALLIYLIVTIGALNGVPDIWIESISGNIGDNDVTVKVGYFGMCLRSTDPSGQTHEKCLTSWNSYSGLSSLVTSTSSSTKSKTDQANSDAINSLLEFASHMQHSIFVGSPAFFPGAGMLFLLSLFALPLLSLIARHADPPAKLVCGHITITSLWLSSAWSFASALATLEAVLSQQEIVKWGGCGTAVTVQMGITNQCLQWIAFFLTAFFAAGMTGLRISQGKDLRGITRRGKYKQEQDYVGNWVQDIAGAKPVMSSPYPAYGTALSHASEGVDVENLEGGIDAGEGEMDPLRHWEQQPPISPFDTQHDHWNASPPGLIDNPSPSRFDLEQPLIHPALTPSPGFQRSPYPPDYEDPQFVPEPLMRASALPLEPYPQPPTPMPAFPPQAAQSLSPAYPSSHTSFAARSSSQQATSDMNRPSSFHPASPPAGYSSDTISSPPPLITIRRPTPAPSRRSSTTMELHNWTPPPPSSASSSSSTYSQPMLQVPNEATRASTASRQGRRESYQPYVRSNPQRIGGGSGPADDRQRQPATTSPTAPYPDDPPSYQIMAPAGHGGDQSRPGMAWQWPAFE